MQPGKLYRALRRKHGRPSGQWALWCRRPKTDEEREQVIIEAVLTQRANWKNVEAAIARLRSAGALRLSAIVRLSADTLEQLIRPSGFYRQKASRLAAVASFFLSRGGVEGCARIPTETLREELLRVRGIGPETCDDILCYALHRPVFVVDEYTRRIARLEGGAGSFSYDYDALQALFTRGLRKDWRLYQDFHALIVIDGKHRLAAARRKGTSV